MTLLSNAGTKPVRVTVDGRTFTARFDANNEVLRISERKTYLFHGVETAYNAVYWNAKHHSPGKGDTIVKRIIAAAREKL